MPRSFEITLPSAEAAKLLHELRQIDGVVSLAHQPGVSVQPEGDVISVQMSNDATREVFRLIGRGGVLESGSVVTSAPRSMISPDHQGAIDRESNETIWDEMAFMLRQDTNLALNYLLLMGLAGAVACAGLWSDTLHVVIGAMVIAPAFEPLARMSFGLVAGPKEILSGGARSAAAGYGAMLAGAVLTVFILGLIDPGSQPLESRGWVQFWSTVTANGILTSTLAASAGAVVILGQRSVLTTGVMVALALIPSMTIVGMAIGVGDLTLAWRGLVRWSIDAMLVLLLSALVFSLKKRLLRHPRAIS